jgi:acetylornithine deacetylase/succinyl-diaminopimelate desuccinylase-like protein
VKLLLICGIFVAMATVSAGTAQDSISKIADDARCATGLKWLEKNSSWITDQHVRLTEIPAPEFAEAARGEALKELLAASGFTVRIDKLGNVIGERPGLESKSVILVAAHLDTVFPAGTDVHVKRDGKRLMAPGISDNGAGLAALAGVARALFESRIRTTKTIVFAGDVGEEGEGNLRGIRALVNSYGARLAAVIAVDGPSSTHITTQGIASRRFEVIVSGPGGHSWSDFGEPNPITAIARGIVKFSSTRVPESPRSSYNFGVIEGGTSINSIPARAAVKVDLRSEDENELGRLESALRDAMAGGAKDEISAWRASDDSLKLELRSVGVRPAGKLAADSPLVATVRSVDTYLGNQSQIESSSTDANVPLSLGIPAIAIGSGGRGAGTHTLDEWFDPAGRELGLKRLYLTIVALAGLES